jgi:uncharacterized protein with von Willebrand factor type A (vWA) domain
MSTNIKSEVLKLATKPVSTQTLKEKLNNFYALSKAQLSLVPQREHFDYLWDLKEKAIIEGKSSIEVPEEWLSELDRMDNASRGCAH